MQNFILSKHFGRAHMKDFFTSRESAKSGKLGEKSGKRIVLNKYQEIRGI